MHLVNGEVVKVPALSLGGGEKKGSWTREKLLQRGQNFDPIDVLQEAVQLKPKPSNMSDFVNYSKHQLLTPRWGVGVSGGAHMRLHKNSQ